MSRPPSTIAHVITRLDVGGAQETALRIAAGVDRTRFRSVILAGADAGSGGSLRARAGASGIEVVDVPRLVGPIRPAGDLLSVRDVRDVLAARSVSLVHTHSSKAGVVGRVAARWAGLPAVHMVHGWSFNDAQGRLARSSFVGVERALAPWTQRLLVVTPQDRLVGLRHHIGSASRYRVVHSGIELHGRPDPASRQAARTRVRRELGLGPDTAVFVSVGRLEPQKDPQTLLRAFARAFGADPGAALVVVGEGSLRPSVEDLAQELGVAGAVRLVGLRDDVRDLLVAADAFVLTSRWEGLPRAVLEAMDAGLPVIASDVGGTSDVVVDGRSGLLVPAGAEGATADAMRRLRDDPEVGTRFADAASSGLDRYSEARMIAAVEAVYSELLPSGPPS